MRECLKVLGTEIHHGEIKGAKPKKAAASRKAAKNGNGARAGVTA
jgi:hypothetical protein